MTNPHPFAALIRHRETSAAIHKAAYDLIPPCNPVYASLDGHNYRLTRNGAGVVNVDPIKVVNLDEPPAVAVDRDDLMGIVTEWGTVEQSHARPGRLTARKLNRDCIRDADGDLATYATINDAIEALREAAVAAADAAGAAWPEPNVRGDYTFPGIGNIRKTYASDEWEACRLLKNGAIHPLCDPDGLILRFPTRELAREALFAARQAVPQ